jgi:transposase
MPCQDLPEGLPISEMDWKQTPPSVRAFILWQQELITQLMKRVEELEAKLAQNSNNSNRPPSSDAPNQRAKRESKGKGKPGAIKGHKGHQQSLLTPTEVVPRGPELCSCGCKEFTNLRVYYTHQHKLAEYESKATISICRRYLGKVT